MIYFIISIAVCGFLINLLLVLLWIGRFHKYGTKKQEPFVSILIAARNEENNLAHCVEALVNQKYPSGKYEILIGNDSSEDQTLTIANKLSRIYKNISVVDIKETVGVAKGKANVLAQLARQAKGEFFLITDADITVNEQWVKAMVCQVTNGTGIVNGFTLVENHLMQHYEWAQALGMVKVLHDLGQPVSAIGNNMLVTREAYFSTGGYERIPFSVTEDFALYKEIHKNGFKIKQVVSKEVLAFSKPAGGVKPLLDQRKRWMTGAVQLPWYVVLILLLEGLYYPAVIAALIFMPVQGLYLFIFKLLFQSIFIKLVLKKVDLRLRGGLLIYELYSAVTVTASMVNFLFPEKIIWKGRKFDRK